MRLSAPLVFSLAFFAAAGVAHADKVDDFVADQMQKQHIPGVSIAVVKAGKPVKLQGYGMADLEHETKADAETVYKIGSLSKQFIATAVMLLSGDGKFGLDDAIGKYFPDAPQSWHAITIRQLLNHTAGMIGDAPGFDPQKVQSDLDVIRSAYGVPVAFEPGKGWAYSNLGYFMLAEIVHQAAHEPWDKYAYEHIFKPAGMNATYTTQYEAPHRAEGYDWKDNKFQKALTMAALRPSGAFESDVQDLVKWDAALRTNKVLTKAQQDAMQTPAHLADGSTKPYGMGWQIEDVGGHRMIHHGGTLPGFRSEMSRFVNDDLTVIVLTNASGAVSGKIALGIADLFIPNLRPKRAAVQVASGLLDSYSGHYQLSNGRTLEISHVNDGLKMVMSMGTTTMNLGVLKAENETRFFMEDDQRVTYVFSKDDQGHLRLQTESEQGKVMQTAPKLD